MANRTKRIFISDIHMGDKRSTTNNNYGWFKKNIHVLTRFLDDQLKATDVKELVILGDLFDTWVIPAKTDALTDFADICDNSANVPVIDNLKKLADPSCEIKLAYVPGNHDMGMNVKGISETKLFIETTFPGIRVICDNIVPWGVYNVGILAAEHGNHYCLFNAPDIWQPNKDFLPLGYFISRAVAGATSNYYDILVKFLKDVMDHDNIVRDLFDAIAADAGLKPDGTIKLIDAKNIKLPGYPDTLTIDDIGQRFSNLFQNWNDTPGNCEAIAAAGNDLGNLLPAAKWAYFDHSNTNIVIFGHTHHSDLVPQDLDPNADPSTHPADTPWHHIYANCGTWIDKSKNGCTYVETEEDAKKERHYVRLKSYTKEGAALIREEFVKL
jgi:UDP-2,3-diacylglucosamine pyrophosphatase LpxH